MKKFKIKLYSFNELNDDAKLKVIEEFTEFEINNYNPNDEYYSCFDSYDDFIASIDENYIIDFIDINDYLFFFNGELANVTTYCGKHEKAGITELTLNGEVYELK